MSLDNEALGKEILTATLLLLLKRVRAGEATAAEMNVAMQTVKAMGIEMIPTKSNAAGKLRQALTDRLPFAGQDSDTAH